jgi:ABC-type glutathione transport system ATPase component
MPEISITVSTDLTPTARMRQVASIFDAPITAKATRTWSGRIILEDRDWQIGLIVGPSGAGKSTIARELFGPPLEIACPATTSVV